MKLLGIDTGGTFTDFVLFDGRNLLTHKVLSTPDAPHRAILQGLAEMGVTPRGLRVVHGSTVATNAVLEGKGVRTAYIGNRGLADLLTIGRQARRALYDLQPPAQRPPVPRELCLETGGRLAADGSLVDPLTVEDLERLKESIRELAPRAVAVNLLYSYLDDSGEKEIAEVMPPNVFVSLSSRVLSETREYERGIATWLNAWVGPLVGGYLQRLESSLPGAGVSVMQSSGETIAAGQAASQAVRLLLSGPAGGLVGARYIGGESGRERLLTFDMGGTSTDVALIDGKPRLTTEGRIGPYPVAVPMVDMHTIGAGGGSIARLDAGGLLQVGPESAGANPGPACYGMTGDQVTVTDANLVLGRLRPDAFLGGRMVLDDKAAHSALERLARSMGISRYQAAEGVVRVANEHMARALRVISVERGIDPRGFTLVSFGGAGGLHVCALAEALGMTRAMVPIHAGVLSALGMLATQPGRQLSRTWLGLLAEQYEGEMLQQLNALAEIGKEALRNEGIASGDITAEYSLDLRYRGQSYTLNLPWDGLSGCEAAFGRLHETRYGHRLDLPVELVNLRVALSAKGPDFTLPLRETRDRQRASVYAEAFGVEGGVPVHPRDDLSRKDKIPGPALITETVATTWLAPGWRCRVDKVGNLILDRQVDLPTGSR